MNTTFADRLNVLLDKKEFSISDLSLHTGISSSSIRGYVAHGHIPRHHQLLRIADALDTTPDYLLYGDKEELSLSTLSRWESTIIHTYRQMSKEARRYVDSVIRWELKRQKN